MLHTLHHICTSLLTACSLSATVMITPGAMAQSTQNADSAQVEMPATSRRYLRACPDALPDSLHDSIVSMAYEVIRTVTPQLTEVRQTAVEVMDDGTYTLSMTEVVPTIVKTPGAKGLSPYLLPYSFSRNDPNWGRYWANIGLLAGAMGTTLLVMECLPEDATSWNRAEIQRVPPFTRWYRNIFVLNPELDHDEWVFNYLLHPYAGAVYFMAARSVGFNFWHSMMTSAIVSTFFWEFGVEAFVERPSYQDIVITPVVGSIIGELFYKVKRDIVANDYHLWGSKVLGNIVAFIVDPVNGLLDIFRGNPARGYHLDYESAHKMPDVSSTFMPTMIHGAPGFCLSIRF